MIPYTIIMSCPAIISPYVIVNKYPAIKNVCALRKHSHSVIYQKQNT